jgi:tetratricopeptide (TPR) repeat protein
MLDEFFREGNPFVALWRMVDAAEIITRFFTITALSDILRQKGEFPEPVQDALTEKLERPTFGAWKELLAIAIDNLPKERGQTRCFVSELPSFVRDKWLPALGSGEDKPEEKLIALRNLIAHAGRLPDEKAQELLNAHRQRFESLAKELSFLANYDLIACTKEGQIVWLKGLPDADSSFPNDRPFLSFDPEHGRVYLVREGKGLDLFPLHAFTDILQWREERYDFERLGEVAPQIYFRLIKRGERGYLECIPFSTKAVFSHLGDDVYQRFRDIFRLEEWREQRRRKAEAQGIQTLWDEQVRELTEVFVGREEHIRQVKDAIKRTSKGVLWISGKPGVGKSALMAKLMQDYIGQTQHYIVIPYFFRYGQAGCSTMDFLAVALKRLKAELNREIEPEPRLPDRQKQLVEALEEAVSKTSKKVLFLVDGLDEIYRLEREFLNVPFMTIRERIVWVCAGRSEGDLEEALKNRGAEEVFPDGLPPLDEQATRAMLIEHLGRLKYALFERDEGERNRFVEAVTRKSEGLPLYVRMVIEDLKAGQLTVRDEGKLPDGWDNYCERLLERWSSVGTVLPPLMCLLAWAKEPITEGTMNFLLQPHHHAGTPRWGELFRKALKYGHLMLQRRPTPDDESGWTIYHDSFRQHLLKKSERVREDREWAQERWLKVCEDWKALASQEPSLHRYILRHYAEHLHERWQSPVPDAQSRYSELCRLALDSDFKQAQTKHLPKEPNLPLKTVQLALDAAIQLEDAPMMARLLIEHAKRAQIEAETPLQAWRKGHRDRALELATDIVFKRNHKLGTLWSLFLAWVAESEGERDCAKRFLDEVRKRWEGARLMKLGESPMVREDWQGEMAVFLLGEVWQVEGAVEVAGLVLGDESKGKLAASWASKELFDRALKVAEGIEDAEWRAGALRAFAEEMAKAGMFDQALKVAERIGWARERARALAAIAEEMAKAGVQDEALWRDALKVAEGIEEARWRAEALREIAGGMAKAGMFEQALKVAEGIEEADERARALRAFAEEMAKAGMFEQALKVAEGIEEADERARALRAFAEEMAKAGMTDWAKEVFDQALKVAERIEDAWKRAEALAAIAVGMAKAGMTDWAKEVFGRALKVAEGIEEADERARALRAFAEGMAKAGMFDQALKVAERIEDAWWRAEALSAIAEEMAKAGVQDEALWRDALKVAEGIEEADERAGALRAFAEEMAKAGMFDQALKVAEGIEEAWQRARALAAIAVGMAKAGVQDEALWRDALKVAEGIEEADERAGALRAFAEEMAKAGMFDQALKVAEGIEEAWQRARALAAIAVGMAKAGVQDEALWRDALKVAEGIEEADERARALRAFAEGMAKAGMTDWAKEVFDQALKVAERIEDAWKRAEALAAIAVGMAKAGMTDWAKEVFGRALKVAEGIEEADERARALRAFAEGMAKAGMFDQALKVAERIGWARERARALAAIAEEMAKAGVQDEALWRDALKVAERIEDAWKRAEALREIAVGMAKAGMEDWAKEVFDQALKVAEGIKVALWRAEALSAIAEEMAKAGMEDWAKEVFDQALKVAEGIEDAEWRAGALREIAGEMAKAGMFDQALKVAEGIEDAEKRARALREIAGEMAKAGMFDQALKVAERIGWARERARALAAIAEEMAKAGVQDEALWRDALKVAERIEDAWKRAEALREIAGEMAKAGMFDQALKVAEGIGWARGRAGALAAIAGEMAKARMEERAKEVFEQVLKVAEGIERAWWRAWALREIAGEMAKAGMFDQALKVAEGIEEADERAWALIAIAKEMAKAGEVEGAVSIVEREMAVRTEGLPSVLKALAERAREGDGRSKEGFLRLLPLCGWSLKFAYQACELLAWLYPERGGEIARVVSGE